MRRSSRLVLPLLLVTGCADVRLEAPDEEIVVPEIDDLLAIEGEYCTSPAADVDYPVKIMFIVDGSGSQQFSDQNRQRVVAVEETINALIGEPNVSFKVIVFNATVTATPSTDDTDVYSNDVNELVNALNALAEADTLTDYQGALAVAFAEMDRDMGTTRLKSGGQAELGRTKYVNILISDGLPDPQCLAGLCNDIDPNFPADPNCGGQTTNRLCEDQSFLNCLLQTDPCTNNPPPCTDCTDGICDYDGTQCYEQPDADVLFGNLVTTELAAGNDYNQPYQILQKVADIMELADTYEVGDLRVHAGLVLDPLVDPAVIEVFGDPAQAIPMMQQVAEIGEGQYLEFYGGDSIDFVTINFDTLKQHRVVRGFYADNTAARSVAAGLTPDTDADGLTDAEEFVIGSDSLSPDTDGDGYNDYLEWQLRGLTFAFDDACMPPLYDEEGTYTTTCGIEPGDCDDASGAPCTANIDCPQGVACLIDSCADDTDCTDALYNRCFEGECWSLYNCKRNSITGRYEDFDSDGLHDCEERRLGTDPRSPDSDSDGIPDQLDLILGLDPMRWDFDSDTDQDGLPNGTEVEWHLSPSYEQSAIGVRERYRYDRELAGYAVDGRPCYDFGVKKIKLTPTGEALERQGLGVGFNRIMLYLSENTADSLGATPVYRVACIWARWVPPNLKMPRDGELRLLESDFYYLPAIDPVFNDTVIDASRYFDPNLHCLEACSQSDDCNCPSEVCWRGACRPARCCDDYACGTGFACVNGDCLTLCPEGDECGGNTECITGRCHRTCGADADCAAPRICWQGHCSFFPGE